MSILIIYYLCVILVYSEWMNGKPNFYFSIWTENEKRRVMFKIHIGRSIAALEWNSIDLKFVPVNHNNKNELSIKNSTNYAILVDHLVLLNPSSDRRTYTQHIIDTRRTHLSNDIRISAQTIYLHILRYIYSLDIISVSLSKKDL